MSANPDKQPWTWGEPYTSINRLYLQLKMRMTPYTYTLSREAYDTGFPAVRAMALEFPDDDATLVNSTGTAMQFMLGPWLLVAPVYRPLEESQTRDGIYLPKGDWVDYCDWSSITSFAKTIISCAAGAEALEVGGQVKVSVAASVGSFQGQLQARSYDLRIHYPNLPFQVQMTDASGDVTMVPEMSSLSELDYAQVGWFFSRGTVGNGKGGVVVVKTPSVSTRDAFSVTVLTGPHVPHITLRDCSQNGDGQAFDYAEDTGLITLRGNSSSCLSVGVDKDPFSRTPAVEMLDCDSAMNSQQQWVFTEVKNLKLQSDASKCIDYESHGRAEMYSCGGPPAQPNQAWTWDKTTGHITSAKDSRCMTAEYVSTTATGDILV